MKEYYRRNNIDAWDLIDVCLSYFGEDIDNRESFCIGNVFKYVFRYKYKGCSLSDLDKAIDYLNRLQKYIKENPN